MTLIAKGLGRGRLLLSALKLCSFRFKKLLYFGSKVVTIRVNVKFCCATSVAYSSIYRAFVDYSKSSPLLNSAHVLHSSKSPSMARSGGFVWLVHLSPVTVHVIGHKQ